LAQLVADRLGVPIDDVIVQHSDTLGTPFGYGTYGSRSAAVGAVAAEMSLQKIIAKARRLAAHLLEASEDDIVFEGGRAHVRGAPERAKTIQELALEASVAYRLPPGMEPFLDETSYYDPPNCTFPFGTHACVVEVDRDTGHVQIIRYVAVDDVGRVINPLIVDGQVHGGIVQGVAQALWEFAAYDEDGNLLTGSMADYAVPRAGWFPMLETDRTETPTPVNPLGVKGAGETGTIASTPAVVNAVLDALASFGVRHIDMPLVPEKMWAAMRSARGGGRP
jgi:carbon-monoxide dehydrogenase large subunit